MNEGLRRAFAMVLAGVAIALAGCQAILGIDPDKRQQSPFCEAAVAYDQRCNVTDACRLAKDAKCANNESIASPGAVAAYTACAALAPCHEADGGDAIEVDAGSAYIDCVAAHYGYPSSSLTSLVASYCTQCGADDIQACTLGQVAQSIATYDDAILNEIRDTCLAKTGDDAGIAASCPNFTTCMNDIVNAADPPPAACNGK